MQLISKRKTTVVTEVLKYKLTDPFSLKVTYINGKYRGSELVTSLKLGAGSKSFRWSLGNPAYIKSLKDFQLGLRQKLFYTEDKTKKYYWWVDLIEQDPFPLIQSEGFNLDNVVYFSTNDHTYRDRFGKVLEHLVHLDYIGGFRENDEYKKYQWEPLKKHLSKHPRVFNLKEKPVEYYNAAFHGQKCLEMDILFKAEWWSPTGIDWKGVIFGDLDPLEIKQFKIK